MAQGKPNSCTICEHPQRTAIDRAIVAGDSLRDIATCFKTSKDAVSRHKSVCMKRTLPALVTPITVPDYQTPAEVQIARQNVRSVTQRATALVDKMEELAQKFEDTGDMGSLLKCAKEVREGLRLLAQLSGELGPNQVNVLVNNTPSLTASPEYPILMRVIDKHPEIRAELAEALKEAGL
jgi:hypothetical protein